MVVFMNAHRENSSYEIRVFLSRLIERLYIILRGMFGLQ